MSVLTHYVAAVVGACIGFMAACLLAAGKGDR